MPRGIYVRKSGKLSQAKGVNPIQVVVDEVNYLRAKAKKKKMREASKQIQEDLSPVINVNERQELEHMRQYLSDTRRVLVDRVNTIILLLESLKSAL
jgi:hypothetical protein